MNIFKIIAEDEQISVRSLKEAVSSGLVTVLLSRMKTPGKVRPCAVGKGMRVKVNANIGSSERCLNPGLELKKLEISSRYGADTVMDLSTGGDIGKIRRKVICKSDLPVGTVPVYEAFIRMGHDRKHFRQILFDTIRGHISDGVDFLTLHTGITRKTLKALRKHRRVAGIVSRGGSLILDWMARTGGENPLYEYFDDILEMLKGTGVALSLGDGCRPGCLADATDKIQVDELKALGAQVLLSRRKKVPVMVEGPGHVPIDQIKLNMELEKRYCHNAPFYVLGPLVTDIVPGYDHITSAIGAAFAGFYGADFICYVTPSEHLGLPSLDEVREGVIAAKIAAHAVDIARGNKQAVLRNRLMSLARKRLDWKLQRKYALVPEKLDKKLKDTCSMCGKYCSMKKMNKIGL